MSTPKPPADRTDFSLFDTEERVISEAGDMVRKLEELGEGVKSLAGAYRQAYREQRLLVRLSDRMQAELQTANQQLAKQAADLTALNAALQAEIAERQKLTERLAILAATDELTGTHSRRHFYELATHELERHRRNRLPLAILALDIDHFKRVNDQFGHAMGDAALRHFADIARQSVRSMDILGRLGGEEFSALLPECSLPEATQVAERLRTSLESHPVVWGGHTHTLTVSIGTTLLSPRDETLDTLLIRADTALYQAKNDGRNRTVTITGE